MLTPVHCENNGEGMSLEDARILVIGGTSGIGLGVATAAAERGAVPIVMSRPPVQR